MRQLLILIIICIGRPQAFTTSTRGDSRTDNEGTDASSPITPTDTENTQNFTYDDMLAAKKIATSVMFLL